MKIRRKLEMNQSERRQKLENLAQFDSKYIEVMYFRFLDLDVSTISEKLNIEEKTISTRLTQIYKTLGQEGKGKEDKLIQEYSPLLLEFIRSDEDLKKWGHIRAEMLRQVEELGSQLKTNEPISEERSESKRSPRLIWLFVSIAILLLGLIVGSRFIILAIPMTPTLEPTAKLGLIPTTMPTETLVGGCTEISSVSLSDQPIDSHLENRTSNHWSSTNDGTGNTVLQANTPIEGADLRFGPEFSNGCIQFRFKLLTFDTKKDENSGKIELNFRILEQNPEQAYVVDFIPDLGRAGLYYRKQGQPDWEALKCNKNGQQQDCKSDPIDFESTKNKWFSTAVDIEGANINVFLKVEGQDGSKWEKIFQSQDSRLKEGVFSVAVGPYTTAYIDDVLIWEAKP